MTSPNLKDDERQKILKELKDFHKELKSYKRLLYKEKKLSGNQKIYEEILREKLERKSGALKGIIIETTGKQYYEGPLTGTFDIWVEAFNTVAMSSYRTAITFCISAVNEAIGKLESDIELGTRDKQGNLTNKEKTPKDTAELPIQLFDAMQFHPKVVEASRACFVAGNYREAILNAFIRLIDYVKEITGLDLDGDDLMNNVFSFTYDKDFRRITKYPIIRINELKNSNDRNEQQGFMFLCKGAAGGIRNPKAHKIIPQSNPLHAIEYLAFASLLMRRIEEGKLEPKE